MRLPDYLKEIGDEAAARLFKVNERRIRSWRYGARVPRPQQALEIERLTKGRVTVAEIYAADKPKAA